MLFLLAMGGLVLWYGNHPEQLQPQGVVQWMKAHLHRGQLGPCVRSRATRPRDSKAKSKAAGECARAHTGINPN